MSRELTTFEEATIEKKVVRQKLLIKYCRVLRDRSVYSVRTKAEDKEHSPFDVHFMLSSLESYSHHGLGDKADCGLSILDCRWSVVG
jgi:hypothetical protein